MPVSEEIDLKDLAAELHGYTGADIKSLCREAAMKSIRRYLPEIDLETEKIPSEVLQSMQIKLIMYMCTCTGVYKCVVAVFAMFGCFHRTTVLSVMVLIVD